MTTTPDAPSPLAVLPPEAIGFLRDSRVARLATADASGRPHNVPVCYAMDGDTIVIVLDEKPKRVPPRRLRRVRNLQENPRVALIIDRYSEDWERLFYVLVEGTAALEEAGGGYARALQLLRTKYPQYGQMTLEGRPVIRIAIGRVTAWGVFVGEKRGTAHTT